MQKKTILIVEDEIDLLNAYREYSLQIFSNVLTSQTIKEAKNIFYNNTIDCILLDNNLPDGKGISLLKELNIRDLNIPIIMITGHANKDLAIDSINTGVCYFLEKPVKKQDLIKALEDCYLLILRENNHEELETLYHITKKTIDYLKNKHHISNREIEVISYSLHHSKNYIIAEKLFISPGTVKRHLHNIFEKLKVSSKEELQDFIRQLNARSKD